eukprot:CAMPEP_0202769740 /NCGR_PEP_ID=MMETSP1388-20130828/37333_1 /ASSEMBLY_ACC=CAM_ASM_000864 /TAXON_ID=37098 /ORGANISM="Isochrysis sp, Strain CCMP1244" /LENGTH=98 /DNA_ID=CAMNT_0049438537 /DNA_START=223 /DNA_END=518 /DNA_ORIENTATION=-
MRRSAASMVGSGSSLVECTPAGCLTTEVVHMTKHLLSARRVHRAAEEAHLETLRHLCNSLHVLCLGKLVCVHKHNDARFAQCRFWWNACSGGGSVAFV